MVASSLLRFLFGIDVTGITRMRSGFIRINAPFLVQLMSMISLYLCFVDRGRVTHKIGFVTCTLAVVFVYQSRLVDLLLVFCLALVILNRYRRNSASFYLVGMGLVIFLVFLLFGPLNSLVTSFSVNSEYGGNTVTRVYETDYYTTLFRDNILNGVGLIAYDSPYHSIISGSLGSYYIDDVGIIGALAAIGLWVIILFLIPILILGKNIILNPSYQMLGWPLLLFIIGTSFTTFIVFPYFDPAWPLFLAVFGFNRSKQDTNTSLSTNGHFKTKDESWR